MSAQIEPRASIFTQEQEAELRRMKAYFPWRIVWGGIDGRSHEFSTHADTTRRHLNAFLRANPGNIAATIG